MDEEEVEVTVGCVKEREAPNSCELDRDITCLIDGSTNESIDPPRPSASVDDVSGRI
jgi:hypothetical protein